MSVSKVIKQKSYEKVIFLLRRHALTFLPIVLLFLLLLLIPVALYFMLNNLFPEILAGEKTHATFILFSSAYYLSTYSFFYGRFIDFYLDMWVVTNDRIVDIEQHGLFHREITELDLYRIQDATATVKGFFATIFQYGDVNVKTASSNTNIIFRNVHRPNHVREQLIKLADEDRKYHMQDIKLDMN
ncbi:MAG: PH domain-containing protein [Candidatus Magasanikbacteria bacterium]